MPSAVAAIISADVSSALGLFAGVQISQFL